MSAPFVTELRTPAYVIVLGDAAKATMHIRVQAAELWDTVRVDSAPSESVLAVKLAALSAFYPDGVDADDFVTKLHGFEILHEGESLQAAGVRNGSTLLLTSRRRRPVK
ncbi:MAG TPA: hypothetical protein VM053_09640 [Gemmatimonadaceae bacterium]|nr:hypothetical protein [Gemmatimonadaceae bacterium]